ncbi:hypothetical protein HRG_013649 [Hirsutella rhossiliensis]
MNEDSKLRSKKEGLDYTTELALMCICTRLPQQRSAGQKGRLTSFQVNRLKDFNTRPTVANRPELTCPTFCGWFKQRSN